MGFGFLEKLGWQSSQEDGARKEPSERELLGLRHYQNGVALANEGLYEEALDEFKHAIRKNNDFAEAHNEIGRMYHQLGHFDKAIKAYQGVLRVDPRNVDAYNNLGIAHDSAGEFLQAIKMYMKALRLKPDANEVRNNLGMAYFSVGSYAEAVKAFNQVLQASPDDAQAHYGLGRVYVDLKNKELALEHQALLVKSGQTEAARQLLEEINKEVSE